MAVSEISDLLGKVFTSVDDSSGDLVFTCEDDSVYKFYHAQDCCENVYIEDICGDLSDLVGIPLTVAEEIDGDEPEDSEDNYSGSVTEWTFYRFVGKGTVTVRWFGTSNGYYSTSVNFTKVK